MIVRHALAPAPAPVGWLEDGLRLDYRARCQPRGARVPRREYQRTFAVALDADGGTDWPRVTCKGCNRTPSPTKSGETHA